MELSIAVDGEDRLVQTLMRFTERSADLSEPLDAMGDILARRQKQEFSAGGLANGKWAPLSPKYAAWKARNFPGAGILERTGTLKQSLTERPFGVDEVSTHVAVFGTAVSYAKYHQDGTPYMPARPPLIRNFGQKDREFAKVLQRWIMTGAAL